MIKSKFIKENDIVSTIPEQFTKIKNGIGIKVPNYSLFFKNTDVKEYLLNQKETLINCCKENFIISNDFEEYFRKYFYHTDSTQNDKIELYVSLPLATGGIFKKVIAELNDFEILFEKNTLIFNFIIANNKLDNI